MDLISALRVSPQKFASRLYSELYKNFKCITSPHKENWRKLDPRAQISEKHKVLFIHIPKCAGTSVDKSVLFRPLGSGHRTLNDFQNLLGSRIDEFRVLVFSRNPWSRLVSAFYYLSAGGSGNRYDLTIRDSFLKPFSSNITSFLESFIDEPRDYLQIQHFRPMVQFFDPSRCRQVFFIQKVEHLDLLDELNSFLGFPIQLSHARKGTYPLARKIYNQRLFDAVGDIYAADIAAYDYGEWTLKSLE